MARAGAAVLGIAGQRVTERREVHADLMGAAGIEVTAQECMRAALFDDLVTRARKAAAGNHRHALAILRMPADRALQLARVRCKATSRDGQVRPGQGPVAELRREGAMAGVV